MQASMQSGKANRAKLSGSGRAFAHISQFHPELTAFRRDLHAHPELGFEEVYTSGRVEQAMLLCGVDEVHTGMGKTGVVAIVRGKTNSANKMIALRADMDALPLQEHNDMAWKSGKQGLMHACGHDGHTTMLVGAARYLAETRNFDGTAVLIFQPGEEGYAGARAMIQDGLFDRFPRAGGLRHPQLAGNRGGRHRHHTRPDAGCGGPHRNRHHRQGRPRGTATKLH